MSLLKFSAKIAFMTTVNHEFIARYQELYEKDPTSKVFAPLAEAYRKMGLLEEALKTCAAGVKHHPDFPSGQVALAKILVDLGRPTEAIEHLQRATELSPENILAHSLLAQLLLELKRPTEALKSFKMVLFLNPTDKKSAQAIKKLESLAAKDFEENLFDFEPIKKNLDLKPPLANLKGELPADTIDQKLRQIERVLSLADAFTVRNDIERALEALEDGIKSLGPHPEIVGRLNLLKERTRTPYRSSLKLNLVALRQKKLEKLLTQINERTRNRIS